MPNVRLWAKLNGLQAMAKATAQNRKNRLRFMAAPWGLLKVACKNHRDNGAQDCHFPRHLCALAGVSRVTLLELPSGLSAEIPVRGLLSYLRRSEEKAEEAMNRHFFHSIVVLSVV